MPVLEIEQEIVYHRSVGLILDWGFQPPFIVMPADVDLVVAVLDHEPVNFLVLKIKNVLGLARNLFRARPISFDEIEISKNAGRDDE